MWRGKFLIDVIFVPADFRKAGKRLGMCLTTFWLCTPLSCTAMSSLSRYCKHATFAQTHLDHDCTGCNHNIYLRNTGTHLMKAAKRLDTL